MTKCPTRSLTVTRVLAVIAAGLVLAGSSTARAQLLYSFEPDLEGWGFTGFVDSDFISVATSTMGATEGLQSMAVETGPTFGWDVWNNVGPGDTTGVYSAFNTVAADLGQYTLDFDVTITADSFANVQSPGNFFLINVAANSDMPNFPQVFNVTPNLNGITGTFPVSIPMTSLPVDPNSSFYQLNIGSNSDHVNGLGGEGVKYFVDKIRFTQLPQLVEETLFSWETPDDPNTPGVNEQFENWTEGFAAGHVHTISSLGATDGSSSLQIDRQSLTSPNFSWGSQFSLSSDIDPDPNAETIDPTLQGIIDDLVDNINRAQSIAFDVRFDDSFPNTPTFTKFGVHFSDDQGTFYDAEGASFNGSPAIGTTGTVTIPLSSMLDNGTGQTLDVAGLAVGTNFLRIGISTNTDGAGIYQIDNFRVISEAVTESADFDGDGFITGSDFLIWQRNLGLTGQTDNSNGDANGDGIVNNDDLGVWESQYGNPAPLSAVVSTVPEPSAWILAVLGCAIMLRRGHVS